MFIFWAFLVDGVKLLILERKVSSHRSQWAPWVGGCIIASHKRNSLLNGVEYCCLFFWKGATQPFELWGPRACVPLLIEKLSPSFLYGTPADREMMFLLSRRGGLGRAYVYRLKERAKERRCFLIVLLLSSSSSTSLRRRGRGRRQSRSPSVNMYIGVSGSIGIFAPPSPSLPPYGFLIR